MQSELMNKNPNFFFQNLVSFTPLRNWIDWLSEFLNIIWIILNLNFLYLIFYKSEISKYNVNANFHKSYLSINLNEWMNPKQGVSAHPKSYENSLEARKFFLASASVALQRATPPCSKGSQSLSWQILPFARKNWKYHSKMLQDFCSCGGERNRSGEEISIKYLKVIDNYIMEVNVPQLIRL